MITYDYLNVRLGQLKENYFPAGTAETVRRVIRSEVSAAEDGLVILNVITVPAGTRAIPRE